MESSMGVLGKFFFNRLHWGNNQTSVKTYRLPTRRRGTRENFFVDLIRILLNGTACFIWTVKS